MTPTNLSKKRILLVFGTRPEAIKMAPLIHELRQSEQFGILVCVTAQHREMLDQVLQLFDLYPNFDLNIMKAGQDLYDVTTNVLLGMRDVLQVAKPDLVLVHGDTSTSTATALAAFYEQIPVGHVEAGLRTHNIYSPWPEEMNRQITSRIATYHFAPTLLSKQNLIAEGIKEKNIFITGNTVVDALYWVIYKINNDKNLSETVTRTFIKTGLPQEKLNAWHSSNSSALATAACPDKSGKERSGKQSGPNRRKLILITGHRRENFGQGFLNICEAIRELAISFPDIDFVYPMHLNPNVRKPISEVFGNILLKKKSESSTNCIEASPLGGGLEGASNVYFIEPLDYLPFVYLMNLSYLVLTDSGGIQEEAPGLGKPVLVMRDTTERPEAIEAGTVKLVGTDKTRIISEVSSLINSPDKYKKMSKATNPYGDGKACKRIVEALKEVKWI